jgi:hypothetical protein
MALRVLLKPLSDVINFRLEWIINYVQFFVKSRLWPELLIMPRGLVTVLLFYSIPVEYRITNFNEGILFFVIVATNVMMMIGLASYKKKPDAESNA